MQDFELLPNFRSNYLTKINLEYFLNFEIEEERKRKIENKGKRVYWNIKRDNMKVKVRGCWE